MNKHILLMGLRQLLFIAHTQRRPASFIKSQSDQSGLFTVEPESNAASSSSGEITSETSPVSTSTAPGIPAVPTAAPSPVLVTVMESGNGSTTKPGSGHELTLKACCGGVCVLFDNLMSMVGLQCCEDTPINAFEKICCNGRVHLRNAGAKYFDRCCGEKPYAWDQVCCRGKVYDGVPQASCCGDVPYSIYDRTSICCGEQLHKIAPSVGRATCCGDQMYDDRAASHFCCGDRLYSRQTHNGCCHAYPATSVEYPATGGTALSSAAPNANRTLPSALLLAKFNSPAQRSSQLNDASGNGNGSRRQAEGYNSTTQLCCDRVYDKREFDFCCYVTDANAKQWTPPIPRPYSSKTHCCDGINVLEMDPKTKTCLKRR